MKYPHGDFETLGDLLQCDIIDKQAQRTLWDCEEIVPKHYFKNISQTFIQGEIVNMLATGKLKGYVQNILCTIEITKLALKGHIESAKEKNSHSCNNGTWGVAFLKSSLCMIMSFTIPKDTGLTYYAKNKRQQKESQPF